MIDSKSDQALSLKQELHKFIPSDILHLNKLITQIKSKSAQFDELLSSKGYGEEGFKKLNSALLALEEDILDGFDEEDLTVNINDDNRIPDFMKENVAGVISKTLNKQRE